MSFLKMVAPSSASRRPSAGVPVTIEPISSTLHMVIESIEPDFYISQPLFLSLCVSNLTLPQCAPLLLLVLRLAAARCVPVLPAATWQRIPGSHAWRQRLQLRVEQMH